MTGNFLIQAAVFLAAAAVAAPLAKKLNISSVLGYLAAGVLIGPYGLGFVYTVYHVEEILHVAEYGVALLLFLIGLELKPQRLWTIRGPIFGLGASQVAISALLLVPAAALFMGIPWDKAVFVALALSLSSTGVREAMTASALLTVVGVVVLMEAAGLSPALGAFLAGALLADSPYRHQIEADIAPFEGLLLGLFFTAVGMALNLDLLLQKPAIIAVAVAGLLAIKAVVLFALGRISGLDTAAARRFAFAVSQGGEFAFVLVAIAIGQNVIDRELAEILSVIVTISMLATPVLLLADDLANMRRKGDSRPYDDMPEEQGHVVIAGFGRFGQIVARILRARGIPFTALDDSAAQVDFVARFGSKAYYGNPARLNILQAAQTEKARAFVLAMDNVDGSLKTAELLRRHFPHVPIYARARNRNHVHLLMALGIKTIRRETFLSSVDLTREVLRGLGFPEKEVSRTIDTFREYDERRLHEDYAHYTDVEKLQAQARKYTEELEEIFTQDATDLDEASAEKPG